MGLLANRLCWLSPKPIFNRLSLACVVVAFICGATSAQVSFVQITDPHLYDDGQESTENKRALIACIAKIDKLIDAGADYKFAVVTGDIGIEKLVKPLLDQQKQLVEQKEKTGDQKQKIAIQEEIDRIGRAIPLKITSAALEVANIVGQSKLKVWLFLLGNNDLIDEKTDTIKYYRDFIAQLHGNLPGKEVVDLCPTDNDPKSGVYSAVDGFDFIGFNNASFKNNNDARRISFDGNNTAAIVARTDPQKCEGLSTAEEVQAGTSPGTPAELAMTPTTAEQLKYVQQVIDRISSYQPRRAYVFYHIPEIDDPYAVLEPNYDLVGNRNLIPSDQYALSSWFVDGCVRARWAKVVTNNDVKGLFAGHFHDWRRDTYQDVHWMLTPDYSGGTLTKLYVCPPLAIKRQNGQATQARGFQAISIDGTGKVSRNIFWYDAASGRFEYERVAPAASRANWLRLSLGYAWASIPSYLPFYLIVVVCLYAAFKGRKRATVIAPFHLPSGSQLPFGEHTVANVLQDSFASVRRQAEETIGSYAGTVAEIKSPEAGLQLPAAIQFEVPTRFAVEVKGFSHESLVSLARKVLRKEQVISGDVVGNSKKFSLLARSSGTGYWSCGPWAATMDGLREGCEDLALRILETIDPDSVAAYEIANGSFDKAYERLRKAEEDAQKLR